MDHTPVQPSELATSQEETQGSVFRSALSQQPPSCQQSVHTIVHRSPPRSRDYNPHSTPGNSSKYTNNSGGSTPYNRSPRGLSGGSSPYLTPPIVEGDEPPPFKPDKEDHASLCMYEGLHSHESGGGQRSRNTQGHSSSVPVLVAPRKRSERKHRITGLTESGQYEEGMGLIETKHNKIQESRKSALISYTLPVSVPSPHRFLPPPQTGCIGRNPGPALPSPLPPPPLSPCISSPTRDDFIAPPQPPPLYSPRLTTLTQDGCVGWCLVAVASPTPSPVQGTLPAGRRGRGDFLPRGATFDRRWSLDTGTIPVSSFLRGPGTCYARDGPTSKGILEDKHGKALETGNGQDNRGHRKQRLKTNGHKSVPDTPATITLRRASMISRSEKVNAGDAHHMSRKRQDDLQDSMYALLAGRSSSYSSQSPTASFNRGVEEALNKCPPFQHSLSGAVALKMVDGSYYRPGLNDLALQRRASGSLERYPLADRSRFAEPVTTFTTSCQASGLMARGQDAPSDEMRGSSTTIQNVQSSSSIYEVIWKDDYTPSDFRVEKRDKIRGTPTTDNQTDSSGTYHSDSSWSGVSLGSLGRGSKGPGGIAGGYWTGNSRRDSVGTCIQFRFESKSSTVCHHTDESIASPATSGDPMEFMESFPSLPERKSTLEWRTPKIGDIFEAGVGEDVGLHNRATLAEVEAEHALDQLPRDRDAHMGLSVPDPPDPTHSSDRGHRSSVMPHPCARPRTAGESKMGFALGISAGLRRRKSNSSSASLRSPASILRSLPTSRIQYLKDETDEVAPACLPASVSISPAVGFPRLIRRSSHVSGSSTPQEIDAEAQS
ncbi:MAG: hypothetical protein M1840_006515 [Geoglossum simile]|nr:MAG: hypothetical protein M1840_006515 [Geoglossum simile]